MIHGNPQKNTGMWASRACEMESNGFICQRSQGVILNSETINCFKSAERVHRKRKCEFLYFVVPTDSGLPAAPALIPASLSKPVELGGVTYRVVEKRLDWTGALHLCESLNGTLATVKDPYQQAYLTLLVNSLRRPAWIGIYNYGVSLITYSMSSATVVSRLKETAVNCNVLVCMFSGTELHLAG